MGTESILTGEHFYMYDVIENFYKLDGNVQLAIYEAAKADKEFLYYNDLEADELEFVWSNATDEPWSLIFPWRVQSTTTDGHKFYKYFVARELLDYLKNLFVGEDIPVDPYEGLLKDDLSGMAGTLSGALQHALAASPEESIVLSGGVRNEALAHCFHSPKLLRVRGSVEFNDTNPLIGSNSFEMSDHLREYLRTTIGEVDASSTE
jgi:hypothetical protein